MQLMSSVVPVMEGPWHSGSTRKVHTCFVMGWVHWCLLLFYNFIIYWWCWFYSYFMKFWYFCINLYYQQCTFITLFFSSFSVPQTPAIFSVSKHSINSPVCYAAGSSNSSSCRSWYDSIFRTQSSQVTGSAFELYEPIDIFPV